MFSPDSILAAGPSPSMLDNSIQWAVAGVIVLLTLVIYGGADLLRFSIGRVRAVASVCFDESIRRRVLWLTPLAIVGVVLVSQFQRPLDEQDAIRQVTKFCFFATGLLVTIVSIIMACTNLPKEIENRVIFTVVTKPTTRLEILLGKIVGFAAVSAAILLIMGVFTWGYLNYRQWIILSDIKTLLNAPDSVREPTAKRTLEYYLANGLLDARYQIDGLDTQVWSRYDKGSDKVRWMNGKSEQTAYIPFQVDPAVAAKIPAEGVGMSLQLHLPWERDGELTADDVTSVMQLAGMAKYKVDTANASVPQGPAGSDAERTKMQIAKSVPAFVRIEVVSAGFLTLADAALVGDGRPLVAVDPSGQRAIQVSLAGPVANRIVNNGKFYVAVTGLSPAMRYAVSADTVSVLLPSDNPQQPTVVQMSQFDSANSTAIVTRGRMGTKGQQVKGQADGRGSVAVFAYRDTRVPAGPTASFELRTTIEKGSDVPEGDDRTTYVDVRVVNLASGKTSEAQTIPVEMRRPSRFEVPAEFVAGGNFDVLMRGLTDDHWIGLAPNSLHLVSPNLGFGVNLLKGYFVLWLFSVLVVTIAIFCSTFLSWPIAVVLTLLLLLGNWGVVQMSDMMNPGVGRQVVGDLFQGAAPAVAETLNRSLEGLTALLRGLSLVLPNINAFGVTELIERGSWITFAEVLAPVKVLVVFGLPILGLSYVFFRNKEVAP